MKFKEVINCFAISFTLAIVTGGIFAFSSKNYEPLGWYILLGGILGGFFILGIILGDEDGTRVD